jgi:hypothetical protein
MLSAAYKALDFGWGLLPSQVRNVWLDILFGKEEHFDYTSVTCPTTDSSSS